MTDTIAEVSLSNKVTAEAKSNLQILSRKAVKGDYASELGKTFFTISTLTRETVEYLEKGELEAARSHIIGGLAKRQIAIEPLPSSAKQSSTEIDEKGSQIIHLPEGLSTTQEVYELLHSNMSLLLRKRSLRGDIEVTRQQLGMDIALAQTLRLCADNLQEELGQRDDQEEIRRRADIIEFNARRILASDKFKNKTEQ